ncbi:phosphate ABC transporter substrate-binding protein PstS [Tsukamurella sp. PLM1]|uniref:phosphate ABC transporter substrate-binding protein PstS n=1 Tax=Tsukamurella sp. PLM1 TaxID=2929795 RepID=UPI00205422CB|nr:phosphate ABC transporter substrate-binding protein PstS [Tsukamurella sp. PLM1]BDH59060.1 phosphate-binding protein PstS [Tsukamurella sp. PLM1]
MNFKRGSSVAVAAVAALSLTLSACGSEESADASSSGAAGGSGVQCDGKLQLKGSGSTAQANAMTVFKNAFAQDCDGANVDYSGNGSGQGITEFTSGLTNFGGSDSPLNADQAKKAEEECGAPALNLPLVFGPIAVSYKLGDLSLNLSAPTLAKIFSGVVTKWNAPEIAAENPGTALPDTAITVVFRSDESGTTENFQKYLASAAPAEWSADKKGKSFKGGTGQGASGNAAVAATVNKAEGTITYAEWSFAKAQKLQVANIITSAGPEAVKLSNESVGKTIESAKFKTPGSKDLVIDTEGFYKPTATGAYPIVLATYEIVCSKYSDAEVGKGLKTFLKVAASKPAQDQLAGQGYAPIPESFRTTLNASIDSIQ